MNRIMGVALLFLASLSFSQAEDAPKNGRNNRGENKMRGNKHRRPPPEALAACKNANESASCSFSGKGGDKVEGTCAYPPNDKTKPLACRPAHPPKHEEEGRRDNDDGEDGPPPREDD